MHQVCDVLEQLVVDGALSHYAIGGATAAGFHGEPLATRDIDVFVFLEPDAHRILISLEPLYEHLARLGFDQFEEEAVLIHGYPVQFLSASPGLEAEAVEQCLTVEWDKHRMRVMRPEHLAAICLKTGRPKDRARLVYLNELPQFDRKHFLDVVRRHGLEPIWSEWSKALDLN